MKRSIRLTLVLALVLAVSSLIVGGLFPSRSTRAGDTPYLSALSDTAVRSADALVCHTLCDQDSPGHWICITNTESQVACETHNNHTSCTTVLCP